MAAHARTLSAEIPGDGVFKGAERIARAEFWRLPAPAGLVLETLTVNVETRVVAWPPSAQAEGGIASTANEPQHAHPLTMCQVSALRPPSSAARGRFHSTWPW